MIYLLICTFLNCTSSTEQTKVLLAFKSLVVILDVQASYFSTEITSGLISFPLRRRRKPARAPTSQYWPETYTAVLPNIHFVRSPGFQDQGAAVWRLSDEFHL